MDIETLIEVLEKSVEKHGKDKVLTLGYLLNLLRLVERVELQRDAMADALGMEDDAWGDR
jgi:hypothetical protein